MLLPLLLLLACDPGVSKEPAPKPAAEPATPATPATPAKPAVPSKAATPAQPVDMAQAGEATRAWKELVESGCDPKGDKTHVWTPLEARILRNVPFAMRGYQFSSAELAAYFGTADRAWYEGHTKDVTLPAQAQACVDTLKAHEDKLRESWPVPPAMEARILKNPVTFKAYWTWGRHSAEKHYDLVLVRPSADGGLSVQLMSPGCDPSGDCSAYVIECDAKDECIPVAAG